MNKFLENEIHNDPVLKGKKLIAREFRNLRRESGTALRIWTEQELDKHIKLHVDRECIVKREVLKRMRYGPPDRFRRQLEKSEESWAVA